MLGTIRPPVNAVTTPSTWRLQDKNNDGAGAYDSFSRLELPRLVVLVESLRDLLAEDLPRASASLHVLLVRMVLLDRLQQDLFLAIWRILLMKKKLYFKIGHILV